MLHFFVFKHGKVVVGLGLVLADLSMIFDHTQDLIIGNSNATIFPCLPNILRLSHNLNGGNNSKLGCVHVPEITMEAN